MIPLRAVISVVILLASSVFASTATFDASVRMHALAASVLLIDCSQYDDLATVPVNGRLTPVGIYKGLSYSNFIVAQLSQLNVSLSGVIPHSNNNVALHAGATSGTPAITAKFSGSKTKSFSLSSFYYGCDISDLNGVVSDARACNIIVLGYKAGSSSPVANETFVFKPLEEVDVMNPPTFGKFSAKFTGLQTVTFTTIPSTLTATIIDDLVGNTVS